MRREGKASENVGDHEAGREMAGFMDLWGRVVQSARTRNDHRLWAQETPYAA